MAGELAAIIAAYGLGVCLVHWVRNRVHASEQGGQKSRVIFVTCNVGMTIEWHLWTFALTQWLRTKHTRVTILDEGSTDDTVRIAERMSAVLHADWEVVRTASPHEAQLWLEQAEDANEVIVLRGSKDPLEAAAGV